MGACSSQQKAPPQRKGATQRKLDGRSHLREYFQMQVDHSEKVQQLWLGTSSDPNAEQDPARVAQLKAAQRKLSDELKAGVVPVIEQAFAAYDDDGSGTLDKEESSAFFQHYTEQMAEFCTTFSTWAQDLVLERMSRSNPGSKVSRAVSRAFREKNNKNIRTLLEQYETYKHIRDRAAFSIIDKDGDHTLQVEEVLRALTPHSKENTALTETLFGQGFMRVIVGLDDSVALDSPTAVHG